MRIQDALRYAEEIHHGEWREGEHPIPYLSHIFEVLMNLRYTGKVTNEDMLCAAVLHDTIESGRTNHEILMEKFGPRVATLVVELTRHEPSSEQIVGLTKPEIWQIRSDLLMADIKSMSDDAKVIKLADRLSNLQDAHRLKTGKKLSRYVDQSQQILKLIPMKLNPPLWQAIDRIAR